MALLYIKDVIDDKVYDRNDILKKDAYFAKTVMVETKRGLDKLHLSNTREDREFIQKSISRQYLEQYNSMYSVN